MTKVSALIKMLLICLFCKGVADAHIDYQALSPHSVRYFQIFGERASSTNYLELLLREKFPDYPISCKYGWKHFPCWYDTPWVEYFNYQENRVYSELEGSEDFLILVIFRNPYDWLRSFYANPWHVAEEVDRSSFSSFICSLWRLDANNYNLDLDPINLCCFKNVMHLRTAKIRNMLKIKEKAPNVYYINYEILRDDPRQVVFEISRLFRLKRTKQFLPVPNYKGGKFPYRPKQYPPIPIQDLRYIRENLDKSLEKRIGYKLK